MRDYAITNTNPAIFSCQMLTKEASTQLPNNTLAADLAKTFNPMNPATQQFDDYSIARTDTHLELRVPGKWGVSVTIPLAYVPLIIDDLKPTDA